MFPEIWPRTVRNVAESLVGRNAERDVLDALLSGSARTRSS
jgi:hypothetical protein